MIQSQAAKSLWDCRVKAPDQRRFRTLQAPTEYDAASIGNAAAAEWRVLFIRLFSYVLAA